jgi:hypothetical protein
MFHTFGDAPLTQEELDMGVITIVDTGGEWANSYGCSKDNYVKLLRQTIAFL